MVVLPIKVKDFVEELEKLEQDKEIVFCDTYNYCNYNGMPSIVINEYDPQNRDKYVLYPDGD